VNHQIQCHPLFQWVQWIQCESHGIANTHTHGTNTRVYPENSTQNTPEIPWDLPPPTFYFLTRAHRILVTPLESVTGWDLARTPIPINHY